MIQSKAAQRYAKAFFSQIKDDQRESVYRDVQSSLRNLFGVDDFGRFLHDPIIPEAIQTRALSAVFQNAHPSLREFVLFLIEKKRIALLRPIFEAFENLYFDHRGIIRAKITSAVPLDQRQMDAIAQRLKDKHKKEVELQAEINDELIGGFKIQIGDIIYDNSFLSQLEKFKQNLVGA